MTRKALEDNELQSVLKYVTLDTLETLCFMNKKMNGIISTTSTCPYIKYTKGELSSLEIMKLKRFMPKAENIYIDPEIIPSIQLDCLQSFKQIFYPYHCTINSSFHTAFQNVMPYIKYNGRFNYTNAIKMDIKYDDYSTLNINELNHIQMFYIHIIYSDRYFNKYFDKFINKINTDMQTSSSVHYVLSHNIQKIDDIELFEKCYKSTPVNITHIINIDTTVRIDCFTLFTKHNDDDVNEIKEFFNKHIEVNNENMDEVKKGLLPGKAMMVEKALKYCDKKLRVKDFSFMDKRLPTELIVQKLNKIEINNNDSEYSQYITAIIFDVYDDSTLTLPNNIEKLRCTQTIPKITNDIIPT